MSTPPSRVTMRKEGQGYKVQKRFEALDCPSAPLYLLCGSNMSFPLCSSTEGRERFYYNVQETRVEWNTPFECCCCLLGHRIVDRVNVVYYDTSIVTNVYPCDIFCLRFVCMQKNCCGCIPNFCSSAYICHVDKPREMADAIIENRDACRRMA